MQEEDKNQPQAGWVFEPGGDAGASAQSASSPVSQVPNPTIVSWTASEYVANPKNTNWYAMLAASTVALAVIVYLITSDKVSTVVIVMLGIIVGVFAARQPNVLEYRLDTAGLQMGPRFYPYNGFKTFSVVEEGAFNHISLLPLKRFMPPLSIHYAPEDEEKIINTLADYLPYEAHKRDIVESISRRVRF